MSTSLALIPAISNALLQAFSAILTSDSPSPRILRERMPVREAIHSSFVSTNLERSSFDMIVLGTADPTPVMRQLFKVAALHCTDLALGTVSIGCALHFDTTRHPT